MTWYQKWFNSPYYAVLYANRNEEEAQLFIDNLLMFLKPKTNCSMLDLACGKGRHANYLASKGFNVFALDIAENNILYAKQHYKPLPNLQFSVADMRIAYKQNFFNYVFNFFTSFGYFQNVADNIKTLKAINQSLKPNGYLLIDFLNLNKVKNTLIPFETKIINNIQFNIEKHISETHIVKKININDNNKIFNFEEKVQAISPSQLNNYLIQTNFCVKNLWGNYSLSNFCETNSDRLIILAQKIN